MLLHIRVLILQNAVVCPTIKHNTGFVHWHPVNQKAYLTSMPTQDTWKSHCCFKAQQSTATAALVKSPFSLACCLLIHHSASNTDQPDVSGKQKGGGTTGHQPSPTSCNQRMLHLDTQTPFLIKWLLISPHKEDRGRLFVFFFVFAS